MRTAVPDGRVAPSDATADVAEELDDADDEELEVVADCADAEADRAAVEIGPLLGDTTRASPPTSMDSIVLFAVAAFWYHGKPHASAIFFTSHPSVKAG
jgi:hypothetical protein